MSTVPAADRRGGPTSPDPADLERIKAARIFFAHQSIGADILSGLDRVLDPERRIQPRLVAEGAASELHKSYFAHARVGRNGDPESKLDAFARWIDSDLGETPQVALLELCYADLHPGTRVDGLFERMRSTFRSLATRHPRTCLVPVTVPLLTTPGGLGGWLRGFTGIGDGMAQANMRRGELNRCLRAEFRRECLFDLARIEATGPDGALHRFERNGAFFESLAPVNSYDGAHLNAVGQVRAARELLRVIGEALRIQAGQQ